MKDFILKNIENGLYVNRNFSDDCRVYESVEGWKDYYVHDDLIFSHRKTDLTKETKGVPDEGFGDEDVYTLIVYVSGNVEYLRGDKVYSPSAGTAIVFRPGVMHMTRILGESTYERYVLHFGSDFFKYCGKKYPMPDFLEAGDDKGAAAALKNVTEGFLRCLEYIEYAASLGTEEGRVLAYSYILQFFEFLRKENAFSRLEGGDIPDNERKIKRYVDRYYKNIDGVSDVARDICYSREHVSRLFRRYFGITLSEYLTRKRVNESAVLLSDGSSARHACAEVGFKSVSSYINAFRKIKGCLPSEYRKKTGK